MSIYNDGASRLCPALCTEVNWQVKMENRWWERTLSFLKVHTVFHWIKKEPRIRNELNGKVIHPWVLRPKMQLLKKLKYTWFTRISHNRVCVLKCLILVPLCYLWYLPAEIFKCSIKMKYLVSSCTTLNPQLLGKIKMVAVVFNQGSDSDYLGNFL